MLDQDYKTIYNPYFARDNLSRLVSSDTDVNPHRN